MVKDVRVLVKAFHQELCAVRVLDPACGTGNFLYVALDAMKRLESEVLALDAQLAASVGLAMEAAFDWGSMVTPAQFLGIEKKLWAKEIAELVLWIGFLQWFQRTRQNPDGSVRWEEPVLRNLHNIECRDAVLAWDREEPVLDEKGKPVTRWDGESMKKSPVTGEEVPDETKRVLVTKLVGARRAEWPQADYVVGNPPFIGNHKMRVELGDGYVEALRSTYAEVPESVNLVMYWWNIAAAAVRDRSLQQAGLITTTTITHAFGRRVLRGTSKASHQSRSCSRSQTTLGRQRDLVTPVTVRFASP
ncbi:MAG: class I SAM-dependent DNA methyltransferase [Deltaproteobacteria bacterium]|nr:class I SAM-dependent DNA methyltransferase [Deltaproteobacteria bacterium]